MRACVWPKLKKASPRVTSCLSQASEQAEREALERVHERLAAFRRTPMQRPCWAIPHQTVPRDLANLAQVRSYPHPHAHVLQPI